MKLHLKTQLLSLAFLFPACLVLKADPTIYFSDNFQDGLTQWNGSDAQIVTGTPEGDAVTFTALGEGASIITNISMDAGTYITFDYEGTGGFLGIGSPAGQVGTWLAGDVGEASELVLPYSDVWAQYSVYVPTSGDIGLEIWDNSPGSPGSAEFANIVDASAPDVALPPPAQDPGPGPSAVPDGGSSALLLGVALFVTAIAAPRPRKLRQ